MRIATIDVGTNTALLLIADVSKGRVISLHEAQHFVRLGEGVDATRTIQPAAMERLRRVLLAYKRIADTWEAPIVALGGTSASRDAQNRDAVIAYVKRETGLDYSVIPGEEEAMLTYTGATHMLPGDPQPSIVIDVGGGSTEVIFGDGAGIITYQASFDIGAVRVAERFFANQPPQPEAIAQATAFIKEAIVALPAGHAYRVVGAAGTALVLALLETQQTTVTALKSGTTTVSGEAAHAWCEKLLTLSYHDVYALHPSIMEGRADVFPAGVLVLRMILDHLGAAALHISAGGVRHGMAWDYLRNHTASKRGFGRSVS